ncbi:fumarylacetoacetate hydrolase family protein [Actinomyces dentalis]|uniref:fumarylacetoacetate hydrolase family protein n=1 Tax=Actinomyces dentalis TaxID=272548 RepID=UPI00041B0925|nr:fumarylacetoacetate hydrolase family protein [Actinomyces dentalis]
MKIARFSTGDELRYGIVEGLPADEPYPSGESEGRIIVLKGDPLCTPPEATGEIVPLDAVRLVSPVIPRSKVVGAGANYAAGGSRAGAAAPGGPVLFLKPNTAVIGPDAPIVLPPWSQQVHHEGELAVVIGSPAKNVDAADAGRVILGYTVADDVSARDPRGGDAVENKPSPFLTPRRDPRGGDAVRAKAFDTSCPLGPWIEIPEPGSDGAFDPSCAAIRTRVDGAVVQEGTTADMITPVPELIALVSRIFTLLPGDVILTGTPAGAGEIRAGQRVEVGVEGIGSFSNPVVRR